MRLFKLSPLLLLFTIFLNIGCGYFAPYPMGRQFAALRSSTLYNELDEEDSIGGIDSNNNGMRDDIENWVKKQDISEDKKTSLLFYSKVLRNFLLIDLINNKEYNEAILNLQLAIECLHYRFKPTGEFIEMDVIEAANVNTEKRFDRYYEANLQHNKAIRPSSNISNEAACNALLEKFGDPLR